MDWEMVAALNVHIWPVSIQPGFEHINGTGSHNVLRELVPFFELSWVRRNAGVLMWMHEGERVSVCFHGRCGCLLIAGRFVLCWHFPGQTVSSKEYSVVHSCELVCISGYAPVVKVVCVCVCVLVPEDSLFLACQSWTYIKSPVELNHLCTDSPMPVLLDRKLYILMKCCTRPKLQDGTNAVAEIP